MDNQQQSELGPELAICEAFKDVYPCWPLIGVALVYNAISIPGMAMNLAVIWVTIRTKSLRGTANFLLALYSFFELLSESSNVLFLWTALSREPFVDYALAIHICAIPFFGMFAMNLAMAFTGFDRAFAVFFPLKYKWIRPTPYLGVILTICIAYSMWMLSIFFDTANQIPNKKVAVTVTDILWVEAEVVLNSKISLAMIISIFLITTALYALIAVKIWLRKKVDSTANDQVQQRLFRTLFCIVAINVGGYLVGSGIFIAVKFLCTNYPPLIQWFLFECSGIFANLSGASNGPILYFASEEYRKAFHAEFARLKNCTICGHNTSNAVHPDHKGNSN